MNALVRLEQAALALPSHAVSAGALGVTTIADLASFTELRAEWTELLESSCADSVFLSWEWLHTWWTHAPNDGRLAILTVRRGEQLVGIAPLLSRDDLFAERLEFLGTGRVGSDYLDVIARRGHEDLVAASLASHVERRGAILDMKQVRVTASSAKRLVRELRRSGCSIRIARTQRCPFIELGGRSWEDYLGSLGAEHRYNFRRKLRKLEARHALSLERVTSEESRRALVAVLLDLHRLRWQAEGGGDGLLGLDEFHQRFSQVALERGWLRLLVLRLDGVPAAALYGFRYGRAFSFYQSGFDPRFRSLGVGVVAMGLAIKSAIEEGAAEFDLLHGVEPYKFHWATRARRLGGLTSFPSGPLGRLSLGRASAIAAARRVLRMLPAAVTGRIDALRRGGFSNAAPTR